VSLTPLSIHHVAMLAIAMHLGIAAASPYRAWPRPSHEHHCMLTHTHEPKASPSTATMNEDVGDTRTSEHMVTMVKVDHGATTF
jgi:hypothetical protein